MDSHTAVTAASWITSGWIDVAMIAGWMVFVALVGRRVWRHGAGGEDDAKPGARAAGPGAAAPAATKRRAR